MANIRPYEAPAGIGLAPTEIGIDAAQGAARRLSAFGQQMADAKAQEGHGIAGAITDVGAVVDADITHRDISAGAANFAQFMAQKNSEWEDIAKNSDPNDRSVQQKFLQENLEPALQQFQQGFSTEKSQAWAQHSVDAYRNHMFEKTTATMSTLAGEAATVNAAKTINGLSSAVAVDPSTHSIDNAIMMLDHSLGSTVDSSPNITAETAARVKTELALKGREAIVKSAVSSMITNNPNVDLGAIQKKYGEYIDGAEMKMFQRAAQTQAKSNALMDRQAALLQRQQADLAVHEGASKVMTDNVSFDPTGKPIIDPKFFNQTLDLARKNPNAPAAAATVRTMLDWGETQQKHEVAAISDPTVRGDLLTRMSSPDKFPSEIEILRAQADHKLSQQDGKELLELQKAITQRPEGDSLKRDHAEFFKQFGPTIDPEMKLGSPTPLGAQGIYKAEMDAYRVERFLQSKGLDPHLAYDPTSQYFLGKPERISLYRPTMQEKLDFEKQTQGTPKKGETAMPAIPPADQRTPGLYETPKGKLRWTGTGWVTP